MRDNTNLLIFNLKTDADDDVLGFTTDWINALAEHFQKVFVITMCAGRIDVAENVQVYSVGMEKGYSEPRRAFEFYRILWRLLRVEKIDACFAHMMPLFAVLGWPLLKAERIPIILWYAHKKVSSIVTIAEKIVDRIVASSKSGFRLDTPKLRIIGQGIDTKRFSPLAIQRSNNSPFTILSVGRISPIKRIEVLIEALGILRREYPNRNVQAIIVGGPLNTIDQGYEKQLKILAEKLKIIELINFVGSKSFREIDSYYKTVDCFVNSSDTDSVDKTVLEAMSSELPIITSNIAFKEILEGQLASQWVIEKGNAQVLCNRLLALIAMPPSERQALGKRLRQIVVVDHSLPSLSGKIVMEISELLGTR